MNRIIVLMLITLSSLFGSCQKNKEGGYGNGPKTNVPATLQGNWMYGQFSMTDYWSQNPADNIGNGLEMAIAFRFNANGTFEQYFTSSAVVLGVVTYQQSVTKGTVEVDEASGKITTHASSAHYKRMKNGRTEEERDLAKSEITATSNYTYTTGTETNGTKAIYLKLNGTGNAIPFLQRF